MGQIVALVAAHGGRAADACDRAAQVIRQRHDLERERGALAAQARASAVVMTAAPLAFTVVAGAVDPRTIDYLIGTPTGVGCLLAGLALDATGGMWMSRITRRAS